MAHRMVNFGVVSRFAPVARLSLGLLGKCSLIGEVEACPGPNLMGQWCPVLGNQADLSFQSYWGDSRDPEEMVLGVGRAAWWKALLPAGTGRGAGRAFICAAQEEAHQVLWRGWGRCGLLTPGKGRRSPRGCQSPKSLDHLYV